MLSLHTLKVLLCILSHFISDLRATVDDIRLLWGDAITKAERSQLHNRNL